MHVCKITFLACAHSLRQSPPPTARRNIYELLGYLPHHHSLFSTGGSPATLLAYLPHHHSFFSIGGSAATSPTGDSAAAEEGMAALCSEPFRACTTCYNAACNWHSKWVPAEKQGAAVIRGGADVPPQCSMMMGVYTLHPNKLQHGRPVYTKKQFFL
jgi:hypothetical protein